MRSPVLFSAQTHHGSQFLAQIILLSGTQITERAIKSTVDYAEVEKSQGCNKGLSDP